MDMKEQVLFQMCGSCGHSEKKEPEWEYCPNCNGYIGASEDIREPLSNLNKNEEGNWDNITESSENDRDEMFPDKEPDVDCEILF